MKKTIFAILCGILICNSHVLLAEGIGYGANNGGNSGSSVTVTTASALSSYAGFNSSYIVTVSGTIDLGTDGLVDIGSNTTLVGANSSATILGTVRCEGVSNVIIKYLNISANTGSAGDNDGVQVRGGCGAVLVDHCNIYNSTDGNLDITHGGGNVTVSWCKFYYTRDNGHNFSNLVGASDDDYGTYNTTWHHNWWAQGCQQRQSATRFGPCHMFNNYWSCSGNDYCTTSRNICEMLSQNNYYNGVEDPLAKEQSGTLRTSGNIFNNCTGSQSTSTDNVFTPPYGYSLDNASNVPSIVQNGAGNTGGGSSSSGGSSSGGSSSGGSVNGTYRITAEHSGKVIDVQNCGCGNGTNVQQWTWLNNDCQKWEISDQGSGWHRLSPRNCTSQAMDVEGWGTSNGVNIFTWAWHGGGCQLFQMGIVSSGRWRIINQNSGKCVDVEGVSTADGANIFQWTCGSGSNQIFTLTSAKDEAIENMDNAAFNIYPNPSANGHFTISLPDMGYENIEVAIFNMQGKVVFQETMAAKPKLSIAQELAKGLYIVQLKANNTSYNEKLMIK